jgi:hypothetical protein
LAGKAKGLGRPKAIRRLRRLVEIGLKARGKRAGIARAIAQGWLCGHEGGTYVRFTDSGAALFA